MPFLTNVGTNFLNTVFVFIFKILIYICNTILTIFLSPIIFLISRVFPSFDQAATVFTNFLNDYAVPGIAFARELFLNVTGYPRALLSMLALIFLAKITYHLSIIPVKFAIKIVRLIFRLPSDVNNNTPITTK